MTFQPYLEPESARVVFDGVKFRVEVQRWANDLRRDVARHPGACAAVVLIPGHRTVLVNQFRHAVRRALLEVPAGTYDVAGESAEDTMRREIREETGFEATSLEAIGQIFTTPGFADERIDLFVAWAEPAGDPDEEGVSPVIMPVTDAVASARDGRIQDAKSIAALLLYADRVG